MADLKAGTTVGGALLWNASNLKLTPVAGAAPKLYYEQTNRIYTTGDKPTPEEIDTVSASRGGTYQKPVIFTEGIKLPKAASGDMPSIIPGNADAASYASANMDISPWWGLGLRNDSAAGIKGRTIVFDVRTGSMISKGTLQADNGFIDGTSTVWSNAHKPSNVDMNAVKRSGGDNMDGTYNLSGTLIFAAGNASGLRGRMNYDTGQHINLVSIGSDDVVSIGQNHTRVKGMTFSLPAGLSPQVRWSSDPKDMFRIYHEGFKPDNVAVGLSNVINELQLKKSGDVARTSDFEFKSLKIVDAPSTDEHAVNLAYLNSEASVRRAAIMDATNWDTIIDPGSYTVQNANGPGSPRAQAGYNDNAKFGILTVSRGKPWRGSNNNADYRIVQEFKSIMGQYSCYRVSERHTEWSSWIRVLSEGQVGDAYVSKSGDWMTGPLSIPVNSWYRAGVQGSEKNLLAYALGNDSLALGDWGTAGPGKIVLRVKGNSNLKVAKSGGDEVNVFTEYYPPNAEQVGLGRVENYPTLTNLRAVGSGNIQRTFKMGTLAWSDNSSTHLAFMVSATSDYGRLNQTVDIVTASSRGFKATDTLTQANVQNYLNITRLNGAQVFKNQSESTTTSYFMVKEATGLTVYMTSANFSDGVNVTLLSKSRAGSTWDFVSTGEVNSVTRPASMIRSDVDYAFTTAQTPTPADVGLGNVQNYKALPIDGSQPLNGTLDITNAARSLYYQSKGFSGLTPTTSGSTVTQWRGSYLNWNQNGTGSTDIINHPGAAAGGFKFWQGTPNSSAAYKEIASISSTGIFTGLSLFASTDPEMNLDALDTPSNQNVWDDGIQLMPGAGTDGQGRPKGGPYPGVPNVSALGTGLKFKSSANRHGQIWIEPDSTQWFRSLRSSDQGGTSGWIANLSNRNFKNYLDPVYISADAVIDFGVV